MEPDPGMRAACRAALADGPDAVRERVRVVDAAAQDLATDAPGLHPAYGLVMRHGVLMYLPSSEAVVRQLARRVQPGGLLSVVARNGPAMAWRPAIRGDWQGVATKLEEQNAARREGRDPLYHNEIDVEARADDPEAMAALVETLGFVDAQWFGVRVAIDGVPVDTPVPNEPGELAALLDAEEALGCTEPYRRLAAMFHLTARRPGWGSGASQSAACRFIGP